MHIFIKIIFLVLFTNACYAIERDNYFVYSNIEDPKNSLVIYDSLEKAAFLDIVKKVTKCSDSFCLMIEDLIIAKPQQGKPLYVSGKKVSNEGTQKLRFLGKIISVDVVTVENNHIMQKYFYSSRLGLVAFKLASKGESGFFLLRGETGVWASN